MAGKRIKGITIEIGGETTGLQKALSDVNKRSNDLKSELRDVERLLKFDPGNAEAAAQKQKLLAEQVENTADKLHQLKDAEKQVQDQVKKGTISEKQYRDFRREIEFTEAELKNMKDQLGKVNNGSPLKELKADADKAKKSIGDLSEEVSGVAGAIGGLAAGGVVTGAVAGALESSSLDTSIEISFEVPESSKKAVKNAVRDIQAYGVDAGEALEGIRRQWALNADASDETNRAVVDGAATISKAYAGIDFTELIQEANEIAHSLDITNEEALGLTDALLGMGFPPEQIDIIAEYGKQLSDAGYNAEEIKNIMSDTEALKSWNIDNMLDGLKEGRIRAAEFGEEVPKAMEDLLEKTDISTEQMQEWGKAVAEGGDGGKKAMGELADALAGIEDDTTRNAVGVEAFGTMWEDQGSNILGLLQNASRETNTLAEDQEKLNEKTAQLDADPAVKFQQAVSDIKTAMEPVLEVVADVISKVAEWAKENPGLTGTLVAVVGVIGSLVGIAMALAPVFVTATNLAKILGPVIGGLSAPIGIAIGAIAAIIGIGVLLYKNWDTIKKKAGELVGTIKTKFNEFKTAAGEKMQAVLDKVQEIWGNVVSFFEGINLFSIGQDIIQGLINGVGSMAGALWDKATGLASGIASSIADALDIRSPSRVMMELGKNASPTIKSSKETKQKAGLLAKILNIPLNKGKRKGLIPV